MDSKTIDNSNSTGSLFLPHQPQALGFEVMRRRWVKDEESWGRGDGGGMVGVPAKQHGALHHDHGGKGGALQLTSMETRSRE